MSPLALVALALGAGVLLGRPATPTNGREARSAGPVVLGALRSYRLTFDAPYDLEGEEDGESVALDRQTDVRLELLKLSAYDIAFDGRQLRFTVTPREPRTVTVGAPLSSSATGSALVLRAVDPVPNPT